VIFNRHVADQLTPYIDGELDRRSSDRVDAHLAECAGCRSDLEQVRTTKTILQEIPLFEAPESLWIAIEAAADARLKVRSPQAPRWRYAIAALAVFAALSGYWSYSRQPAVRWTVETLDGSPSAGNQLIGTRESVPAGEWIETDARSRARIQVGEIGSVEVGPNTGVRLLASGVDGHRLALRSGSISAKISAPPRLFFVETPAGTAVDLGCEYRLYCDRNGTGILNVSQGWVSLEWRGRESLVPAGASCRMRPGRGPGSPWFDDAPAELTQSLERFDFNPDSGLNDLDNILARSRARDTLTLWHLLSRVEAADRSRVYERMAQLTSPPAGITREKILSLDRQSLTRWKDELAWTW
jgi:predicted anti-sigma-YlaC factor YlaD